MNAMGCKSKNRDEAGYALLTVVLLAVVLMGTLAAYFTMTRIQLSVSKATMDSSRGFYAAEAGLNLRAEEIRQQFLGYLLPTGSPPSESGSPAPCVGSNQGNGDMQCQSNNFGAHAFITYVTEDPSNPISMVVPPGEPYENLNAQRFAYRVHSISSDDDGRPEAILDLEFNSTLVPMFQFGAFYNKDLEIHPGPPMTLAGPVHSNGDLYVGSMTSFDVLAQLTTAGDLYQGRKTDMTCYSGTVRVPDPGTLTSLPSCPSSAMVLYDQPTLDAGWNGMIRTQVEPLTVPPPQSFAWPVCSSRCPGSLAPADNRDSIARRYGVRVPNRPNASGP